MHLDVQWPWINSLGQRSGHRPYFNYCFSPFGPIWLFIYRVPLCKGCVVTLNKVLRWWPCQTCEKSLSRLHVYIWISIGLIWLSSLWLEGIHWPSRQRLFQISDIQFISNKIIILFLSPWLNLAHPELTKQLSVVLVRCLQWLWPWTSF